MRLGLVFGTGKSSWLLAGHFILASRVGFSTLVAEPGWVHPWLGSLTRSPYPGSLGAPPRSPLRLGAAAPETFAEPFPREPLPGRADRPGPYTTFSLRTPTPSSQEVWRTLVTGNPRTLTGPERVKVVVTSGAEVPAENPAEHFMGNLRLRYHRTGSQNMS